MLLTEGTIIAGKYRLGSLLGRGGMGAVWRAHDIDLDAPVAIKLLDPLIAASGDGLVRFHREAEAAAALRSPHVVQIISRGVDEAAHQPYIVMELMEGQSLADRLEREGRLLPQQTSRILTQVARALARAHEAGVVHRDLKPDNIFLVRNDDEDVAKVLDFGIAKSDKHRLAKASETRTGAVMGTPYYMSPEQISSSKAVDLRTDLWAFGVIACECLTGHRPFEADTYGGLTLKICAEPLPRPSELGPVPPGFDAWFARAAARDTVMRFSSAREAADELRRVCGEQIASAPHLASELKPRKDVHAPSTSPLSRTTAEGATAARRRPLGWLAGAGVVIAAVTVGGALWFSRTEEVIEVPATSATQADPSTSPAGVPAPTPAPVEREAPPPESAAPVAVQAVPSATARRGAKVTPEPVTIAHPAAGSPGVAEAPATPLPAPTTAPQPAGTKPQQSRPPPAPPSEDSATGTRK